ncbi:unnamed protein product [Staurois parvus]|uniref:Uncharacterized protein n=1 Tax=Staurois parvus TaxID=386267 RepID=A0ABN9DAD5_9NEOB|nr:unnamed protein product [Staurois parvus]
MKSPCWTLHLGQSDESPAPPIQLNRDPICSIEKKQLRQFMRGRKRNSWNRFQGSIPDISSKLFNTPRPLRPAPETSLILYCRQ